MNGDPATSRNCFVDSNVWLYALLERPNSTLKTDKARALVTDRHVVSTQVIAEVCVNLLRKGGRTESEIRSLVQAFYSQHHVMSLDEMTMISASNLRTAYSLSFWDSLIVAAALEAQSELIYSEDMQHGLLIDHRLRIVNPFVD